MQKSCFLFGHADAPQSILPILVESIENLISKNVADFFVGYHGNFDRLAATALRQVKKRHSNITATLVLAYHPAEQTIDLPQDFDGSFYPMIVNTPKKYAIVAANKYMICTTDSVICYVRHFGNTRALLEFARGREKKGLLVIENLAEI